MPANANNTSLTWASSNDSIATVTQNGLVNFLNAGNVTITATAHNGVAAICSVESKALTVIAVPQFAPITVEQHDSITLPTSATLTIADSSTRVVALTWESFDTEIIGDYTLFDTEIIGDYTLTAAYTTPPGITGEKLPITISISVIEEVFPVENIALVGDTAQLTPIFTPENATDKSVTWSSSDDAIAEVDANGLVTFNARGNATITVTTNDGNHTATCAIEVIQQVESVSLDTTSLSRNVGDTKQLTATILPTNANNKNITWNSDNEAVATVDSNGLVTFNQRGNATITVTTEDGNHSATCAIEVIQQVEGVELNKSAIRGNVGDTQQLTATITPANANNQAITWNSDNEEVASVDSNGLVTFVAKGTATITATTEDGNYTATCAVETIQQVTEVQLSEATLHLGK